MRKGSKEAKAWGRKMKRLRSKPKTKRRKKSTRKGQRRKTARRAYEGLTVRVRKRGSKRKQKRTDNEWSF